MTETTRSGAERWRWWLWGLAGLAFLAPAAAMGLTDEMNWGPGDFLLFGALLAAGCAGVELVMRTMRRPLHRLVGGLAVLAAVVLVWAELAVGVF